MARPKAADVTGEMLWPSALPEPERQGRRTRTMVHHLPGERVLVLDHHQLRAVVDALRERLLRGYDPAASEVLQRLVT